MNPVAASSPPAVPMLDLSREFAAIRDQTMAAIEDVCASQAFILGPAVSRFEAAAARSCASAHAFGCSSGTDALWLALAACGVGPGDAVVTTPFSFFATASAILRCGATVLFADVDPRTLNLAPTAVAEAIEHTPAKAILPVHLFGQCAAMDEFDTLAASRDIAVVEDAAQAFGALWNGRPAGSLGAAAAFSFYPTKNLSAFGDAGMVTCNDARLADKIHALRNHGMRRRYFHDEVGWNARMDGIQAAVLEIKLRRLPAANARRREIAALYDRLFTAADLAGILTLPFTDPRAEHVFHQYVIRAPRRDELRASLTAQAIGSEVYYPLPLHLQPALAHLGYRAGQFPHAEKAAAEVLALPIYPELRDDEAAIVVDAIAAFFRR